MTEETLKKITYFLLGAVLVMFCWLSIVTGFVVGVCEDVLALTEPVETIPETEVVEPTEAETTPVETSIPEVEETIPVETIPETTEPPVTEEPEIEIDQHELEMLACVIYKEAGADAQCDECRRRVADVVLNRVADPRFPDTIEDVLTEAGQYGSFAYTGVVWPEKSTHVLELHAVERAYRIAEEVLRGNHSELYGNGYIWQARFIQGFDNVYCCGQYFGKG